MAKKNTTKKKKAPSGLGLRKPRNRTFPDESKVRALESRADRVGDGGDAVTGGGTLGVPRVRKSDGVATRSTTVTLPVDLADWLRVVAAKERVRQSAIVQRALEVMRDT